MKFNVLFKRAVLMLMIMMLVIVADSCVRDVTVSAAELTARDPTMVKAAVKVDDFGTDYPDSNEEALEKLGVPAGETGFVCMIVDEFGEILAPTEAFEYVLQPNRQYLIYAYFIWHGEYDGDTLHDADIYLEMPKQLSSKERGELIFHFGNDRHPLNMVEWLRPSCDKMKLKLSDNALILSDGAYMLLGDSYTVADLLDANRRVPLGNQDCLDGRIVYDSSALRQHIADDMIDWSRILPAENTPIVLLALFVETEKIATVSPAYIAFFCLAFTAMVAAFVWELIKRKKQQ